MQHFPVKHDVPGLARPRVIALRAAPATVNAVAVGVAVSRRLPRCEVPGQGPRTQGAASLVKREEISNATEVEAASSVDDRSAEPKR
jgi:hypothetical protein